MNSNSDKRSTKRARSNSCSYAEIPSEARCGPLETDGPAATTYGEKVKLGQAVERAILSGHLKIGINEQAIRVLKDLAQTLRSLVSDLPKGGDISTRAANLTEAFLR